MAEKNPVQSEYSDWCNCAKLKEQYCIEIKDSLEACAQAYEDVLAEKEKAVAKELKEAKAKINKLQKTLSAFQLATTVGVTILGQEAFSRVFTKVEEVQNVQTKITETAPVEKKQTTQASKEPEKISKNTNTQKIRIDFTDLLQQFESLDRISQAKIQITKAEVSDTPWIPEDTTVTADTSAGGKLIIDPPIVPPITVASVTNYDFPLILTATPNTLPAIQYPLLPFQDSPFVFGQFETSVIPEFKYTGSISLLGAAAYMSPRRRNV
jgi:hypothetical protein